MGILGYLLLNGVKEPYRPPYLLSTPSSRHLTNEPEAPFVPTATTTTNDEKPIVQSVSSSSSSFVCTTTEKNNNNNSTDSTVVTLETIDSPSVASMQRQRLPQDSHRYSRFPKGGSWYRLSYRGANTDSATFWGCLCGGAATGLACNSMRLDHVYVYRTPQGGWLNKYGKRIARLNGTLTPVETC